MSLRSDAIIHMAAAMWTFEYGSEPMPFEQDAATGSGEVVLDALLDFLTDHAGEWAQEYWGHDVALEDVNTLREEAKVPILMAKFVAALRGQRKNHERRC